MKIYLSKLERKELLSVKTITVERKPYLSRVNYSSILYGVGTNHLWDKIDRVWVYGNTSSYIKDKCNVDRRKEYYPKLF